MKVDLRFIITVVVFRYEHSQAQLSRLDTSLPELRFLEDLYFAALTPLSENIQNLQLARKLGKVQPIISDSVPFPCLLNNTRSETPPLHVHALRPGDIDIVGAMGDSLTAGSGLLATNLLQLGIQNRGLAFSVGGQGTWRQYLTLPNILKEFNPSLTGYSLKDSFVHHAASQFNVGEGGAISSNMPYMAEELVRRIKTDPRVNIKEHWKMITFMVGDNDFCSEMCYYNNPEVVLEMHRRDLMNVLRILRDNLPRTIVNIILTPHLRSLKGVTSINKPLLCIFTQSFLCPCMFGVQYKNEQQKYYEIMRKWQEIEVEVTDDPEFDKHDFTVVAQPFTTGYNLIPTNEGLTDYSYLSEDCFHLSQKGGARAALSLWNNIIEPVGDKSTSPADFFNFKCPSLSHPYIFTRRNSVGATR